MEWIGENWFSLVQTLGILTGLLVTGRTLRSDLRSRRITDQLTLTQLHRDLWRQLREDRELLRILAEQPDLVSTPVTAAERDFLNSVFVHFINGWLIARAGGLLTSDAFARDVRSFFRLPIPCVVWLESKDRYDPDFAAFVKQCFEKE